MRIKDFENAIGALNCHLFIDEIVLMETGPVKSAYGHTEQMYLKWDDMGRGFSCHSECPLPTLSSVEVRMEVEQWDRDADFDLKFE